MNRPANQTTASGKLNSGSSTDNAAKKLLQEVLVLYKSFVQSRAHKRPAPHELDPKIAVGALAASVRGFAKAASSHYVIDKFIKSGTPIVVTLLIVYLLGRLLLLPVQLLVMMAHVGLCATLGSTSVWLVLAGAVMPQAREIGRTDWASAALRDLVATASLLCMLLLRNWIHKPIFKCFIHTLRDVNPPLAKQIETTPALPKPRRTEFEQSKPLYYKVGRLLLLTLLTTAGRRTPIISWFVAPIMLFGSSERLFGTERALLLAALGFIPLLAPWALEFLSLWRASHVTGSELLEDYASHAIPGDRRDDWYRNNEVAIFCFMAPLLTLMKVPILGPLLFLPAAAAAAYLADYLHRLPSNALFELGAAAPPPTAAPSVKLQ